MGFVEQYLSQLNTEKQRFRCAVSVLSLLSLLVVAAVGWNLRLTGVTLANDASCGITEHQHSEECPVEKTLCCDYPEVPEENPENPEEVPHVHGESCWKTVYLCGLEEHFHIVSCYTDPNADVETAEIWGATVPLASGQWAGDLVLVAQSQLGCGESEKNFQLAEDGQTRKGITRYGQWYGNPYGDWSSMFVMFCLNYAYVPQDVIPWSPGVSNMMQLARDKGILSQPDAGMGAAGNILFLDTDGNGSADHSLIAAASDGASLTAIGGDWDNMVSAVYLTADDSRVLAYINVAALQTPSPAAEPTPEPTPEPEEEETLPAADPSISLSVEFPADEDVMYLCAQTANIDDALYIWQWQVSADGNEPWTDIEGAETFYYPLPATEENGSRYYRLQGRKAPAERMTFAIIRQETTVEDGDTITSGSISPFSLDQNNSGVYTIDVYAYPVNENGQRIQDLDLVSLGTVTLRNESKIAVASLFDASLGDYVSAFFGTRSGNNITVATGRGNFSGDNLRNIWRYTRFTGSYFIAVENESGRTEDRWTSGDNDNTSLYLRYRPRYIVTFASEGFDSVTETLGYGEKPQSTAPGAWSREGVVLLGWTVNDGEQLYTFDEVRNLDIRTHVTYRARWEERFVTVRYELGEYTDQLYPMPAETLRHSSSLTQTPTPIWRDNTQALAFDGWYLDANFTSPLTPDHKLYEDTTLYAKWLPRENGYYVYFKDFVREGEQPLVLMTSGVTAGRTVSPHDPGNPPEGSAWDGKWYLDEACTQVYDFSIPVSEMTDHLIGVSGRDLYLYPGTMEVCRAIFNTNGTMINPVSVPKGGAINLDEYVPERYGYIFAGWTLKDGTAVSGSYTLHENTTFYATWTSDYVPFSAILRTENANDTGMTQAGILGTWYAKAGSRILVKSTYTGSGTNRRGTHTVVCVLDGVEYPVYADAALSDSAELADAYATYFVYNNTGTAWTDRVNWDDVYTGGEIPYSTRPISSAGDTIIYFDYMRMRCDITFTMSNSRTGAYIDIYKLYKNGLITGSVTYTGDTPTGEGRNVSATGVSGTNIRWTYTAGASSSVNNSYTLHDIKYGQRIYEVYPVGNSWLTTGESAFRYYKVGNTNFASRREDATEKFFTGSGRSLRSQTATAYFQNEDKIALMYALECLPGETADFTVGGVGYRVQTQLCEVVNSSGSFSAKELYGCEDGKYSHAEGSRWSSQSIGDSTFKKLFGETYWDYYSSYDGVTSLDNINEAYIFYYGRDRLSIQFNFAYDSNNDGSAETAEYGNIPFGASISEYRYGAPNSAEHPLLQREGYEFVGWLDENGVVMEEDQWDEMTAHGDSASGAIIFVAKWEKLSNNLVEYYEDVSSETPFETHYFEDSSLLPYPTMSVYPQNWLWKPYGQDPLVSFDWNVPMYGAYGVQEVRQVQGEDVVMNVVRIYGKWDESHTRVVYDPNPAQGGVPGTAPVDDNEYMLRQTEVPVMSRGTTANMNPDALFVGWLLDRNNTVYQPGDHVAVNWPRTMIFTAQWAQMDEVVHLRYDPNGGSPADHYPNDTGFNYRKNATASVWDNETGGKPYFTRSGYSFTGWNTAPDGSGTAYQPGANIRLTDPVTTLYAQWQPDTHGLRLHKADRVGGRALPGAVFELYKLQGGEFRKVDSKTTGSDGNSDFTVLETDALYKLVETRPPDGYAVINKEIHFRLRADTDLVVLEFCNAQGTVTEAPEGAMGEYMPGVRQLMLTVENVPGYMLPSTGGIGVPLFTLLGAIFMLAPFIYVFGMMKTKRQKG